MPINSEKSVICIGHSVGGQLCRYYAKNLKSIKAIVLLDSMPVQNWFQLYGQALGQSAEDIHKSQLQSVLKVQAISAVWPLFVGTQILPNGAGFFPQEMQSWSKWQIRTVKNWYAQSLGAYNEVHSCDLNLNLVLTPLLSNLKIMLMCPFMLQLLLTAQSLVKIETCQVRHVRSILQVEMHPSNLTKIK